MLKKHDYRDYDYIEWETEAEAKAPKQPADDRSRVESLFDAEIRRRIGELIARARQGTEKSKK